MPPSLHPLLLTPGYKHFFKKMSKIPGVGTHKLSKCPGVGTKKEGKYPAPGIVAFQHFCRFLLISE